MAKCLRCGGGNEWIQGKVKDEPDDTGLLRAERDNAERGWRDASASCARMQDERDAALLKLNGCIAHFRHLTALRAVGNHRVPQEIRDWAAAILSELEPPK